MMSQAAAFSFFPFSFPSESVWPHRTQLIFNYTEQHLAHNAGFNRAKWNEKKSRKTHCYNGVALAESTSRSSTLRQQKAYKIRSNHVIERFAFLCDKEYISQKAEQRAVWFEARDKHESDWQMSSVLRRTRDAERSQSREFHYSSNAYNLL